MNTIDFEIKYEVSKAQALRKVYLQILLIPGFVVIAFLLLFLVEAIWLRMFDLADPESGQRNLRLVILGMIIFTIVFSAILHLQASRHFRRFSIIHVSLHLTDQSISLMSEHGKASYAWSFVRDVKQKHSSFVLTTLNGSIEIPNRALTSEHKTLIRERVSKEQQTAA